MNNEYLVGSQPTQGTKTFLVEILCKYMSFFSVFVGQNNQSLQKSAFFGQNLANSLIGKAELFAKLDVKAHGRHRSQQFVGLLPDALVTLDGGWSHDDRSLKMFNFLGTF